MYIIDFLIFGLYFIGILLVGFYFYKKNTSRDDYFVGSRNISAKHVGLSIVATDVGGGFSIGLGGLGFVMGLAGSWLLFTGLVGAWLAAILIIPKIKKIDKENGMITFPDFLRFNYGGKVASLAAIISGIGYLGFTGAQILAGAKLAAGTVFSNISFAEPLNFALFAMAGIVLLYTVLGGIKAVIYTDTIQWIVLLIGLFVGALFAFGDIGSYSNLKKALPNEFFDITNIEAKQLTNWIFTIVPVWFIAMTLYQRIFACKDEKEAKKAFFIAGIFEYPIMAFIGVTLGMFARYFFPDADPEMAMPMLLKDVLPIGIKGLVIAAYFSAIMSTADSCLIASSGNFVNDIIERYFYKKKNDRQVMRASQITTLIIGLSALLIASYFNTVLELILHAYSFMVAGLFVPTLGAYFWKKSTPVAAFWSMLTGGGTTLLLIFMKFTIIDGIDNSIFGILISLISFITISLLTQKAK